MVLHDIADDAKLIKVATTTLGTEGFFEGNLDVVNVISIPSGSEELVTKSQNQNVLYHLLAQVMVDAENLLFVPVGLQRLLKIPGAN